MIIKQKTLPILFIVLAITAGLLIYNSNQNKPASPEIKPTDQSDARRDVMLYYYNPRLDTDPNGNILCSTQGLVGVDRQIPPTETPIQDTIKLLISGDLSQSEQTLGLTSEFPLPGFELVGANLSNGTLTLEFTDPENKTVGGSCRVTILWNQIETTAKQFSEVNEVKFIPEDLFQP